LSVSDLTGFIKQQALLLGFSYCGISKAEFLEDEAPRLETWLNQRMHGEMKYMERYFEKRLDPTLLVDGAKSVISLLYNYYPKQKQRIDAPQISKYAYGEDYHEVIREKMNRFLLLLKEKAGHFNGRGFVDSAPVLDKVWAKKSGLGWIGKNANLITREQGSFFFIAELITDLELEYDGPMRDFCGTCTRCIDSCPTDAIVEPYVVDGSKCISYLTIELKNNIPNEFAGRMENWIFGCDVCQDVCPWNRFSIPHDEPAFNDRQGMLALSEQEWQAISEETFGRFFSRSALKRTGYRGLRKNLVFNGLDPDDNMIPPRTISE
jgi:epoxyqueuosine reductase